MAVATRRGVEIDELSRDSGAGTRTRTEDLLITNQLLYQLSYAGQAWGSSRSEAAPERQIVAQAPTA